MVQRTRKRSSKNLVTDKRSACREAILSQPNKRRCRGRITNKNNSILTILDPDALLQVLLRTDCHDHGALWRTCREFRAILDSSLFAEQRATTEWAQVEARPWSARELFYYEHDYDEDDDDEASAMAFVQAMMRGRYNPVGCVEVPGAATRNHFRVTVDGIVVGQGSYDLVERLTRRHGSFRNFHALCDQVSQELQEVACLFFNRHGGVRLREVREALEAVKKQQQQDNLSGNSKDHASRFLYISSLKLHPLYRDKRFSWIGANAMRSLLRHPVLVEEWDISVYIGDSHAQFTAADVERQCAMQERSIADYLGDVQASCSPKEKADWKEHLQKLAEDDIQPLLRAGFVQTAETVLCTSRFHVFCLPQFLETKPLLTKVETEKLKTITKRQFSLGTAPAREQDCSFLQYIVTACVKRNRLRNRWEGLKESTPTSMDQVRLVLDQGFQSMVIEHVTSVVQSLDASLREHDEYCNMLRMNLEYMQQELVATQTVLLELQVAAGPLVSHDVARLRNNLTSLQNSVRELEQQVTAKEQVITQAHRRRSAINVDGMLSNAWFEYHSQRDSMASRMFQAAQESVVHAQDDIKKHDLEVREEISRQVRQTSVSVSMANALHACAANMLPEYIDMIWQFVPDNKFTQRAALSKRDENGATPLMAVAGAEGSDSEKVEQLRYKTAEKLVDLGTDKNITNGWGETALGVLRKNKRNRDDFRHAYHLFPDSNNAAMESIYTRLEQLLRPFGGPTEADDAVLDTLDTAAAPNDDGSDIDEDIEDDNDFVQFVLA